MNEEQARRLAQAAEAFVEALAALAEARAASFANDLEASLERVRQQAARRAATALEQAARRLEEAATRTAVALAALRLAGAFAAVRRTLETAREVRARSRTIPDADGGAARRSAAQAALEELERASEELARLLFPE